ncbi:hypothetical protein P4311_27915 [Bacillus thuringiensis]|nr:hypothetical protein [Bacillus thuringiensis]MRB61163.1 hypothetical protein [Bacillus thuringiensis]
MFKYKIFLILICLLSITFQKTFAKESRGANLFITFTDVKDPNPRKDYVNYYLYNSVNNKEDHLLRQLSFIYPTGIVSNDKKNLYINGLNNGSGKTYVQLYHRSLLPQANSRNVLLTSNSNIHNVDHMRINNAEAKIYMRVLQPNYSNCKLATYDLKTKKTEIWNKENKDNEVHNFDYSPVSNQLITLEFSSSEEMFSIERANREQELLKPLTYHVILYDSLGNKIREVTTIKKHILDISFSPDAKSVLLSTSNPQYDEKDPEHIVYVLNLETGETKELFRDTEKYKKIKQAQYSPDGKKIYFLTVEKNAPTLGDQEGRRVRPRILAAYDVDTGKISEVWKKEKGTINNFLVLY